MHDRCPPEIREGATGRAPDAVRTTDYAGRPAPYALYTELREAGPVVRQADGSCLVGTYHEIAARSTTRG